MKVRLATIALLALLSLSVSAAESRPEPDKSARALQTAGLNAKDLKTIHYIENAHGQLDEWSARLIARLERDKGPRNPEPVADGRARFQIDKLRVTYAGYTHNDVLVAAINLLADAHERRLDALDSMLEDGADRERYDRLSTEVDRVIHAIRNWRAN